jgi:hypothetical protein
MVLLTHNVVRLSINGWRTREVYRYESMYHLNQQLIGAPTSSRDVTLVDSSEKNSNWFKTT